MLAKAQLVLAGTDRAANIPTAVAAVAAAASWFSVAVGTVPFVDRPVGSVEPVNIGHLGNFGRSLDYCTLGCTLGYRTLDCTAGFVIRNPLFRYF